MSTAILISIILITLVYVFWPYLFQRIYIPDNEIPDALINLMESRDNMLSVIKDLEFDYDIGKLSIEDFTEMNAQYRNKAISIFREIELHKKRKNNERREQQIPEIWTKNEKNICVICNKPSKKGDRYCRNCGYQLNSR